eukprot:13250753-Alexandrium_andersonii.AAC.1
MFLSTNGISLSVTVVESRSGLAPRGPRTLRSRGSLTWVRLESVEKFGLGAELAEELRVRGEAFPWANDSGASRRGMSQEEARSLGATESRAIPTSTS